MEYQESIDRLLSLVDYERARPAGPRQKLIFDLARMEALLERVSNPHLGTPTIHVAGTKGKGSTAAFCDAALSAAGHRTGFYSSPHMHTFRERIRLEGEPVDAGRFAQLVQDLWEPQEWVSENSGEGPVSLFEFMTAMGFCCFKEHEADFQTIEVGLGGRLDATNVVHPSVCVITSISMDHTEILGDTVEKIAREKAGIIKPGATVVVSPQQLGAAPEILAVCRERGARAIVVGEDVTWEDTGRGPNGQSLLVRGRLDEYSLDIPLLGTHQLENAATAVAALEALTEQGHAIPGDAIARGFGAVRWPCRMEVLSRSPLVVADGAHNAYSMASLLASLPRYFDQPGLLLIAGFSRDKSVDEMVDLLAARNPRVVVTRSRHPRSTPPADLAQKFRDRGLTGVVETTSVKEAIDVALQSAGDGDLVLGTGSLFVAAEVREALLGIEPEVYPDLIPRDLRAQRPAGPETCGPRDLRAQRPAGPETCGPRDLRAQRPAGAEG